MTTASPYRSEERSRDVLRVLCRIPVNRGQLVLYRLAGENPNQGFTSTRVRELLGLDRAVHRGMMAAPTGRTNNTPSETSRDKKPGLGMLQLRPGAATRTRTVLNPNYLDSIGVDPLGPEAPAVLGISTEATCFVSPTCFQEDDPFADFLVHEVVEEAASRRNGWKHILRRRAPSPARARQEAS